MASTGQADRAARLERAIALKRASARSSPGRMPRRPADHPPRLGGMQRSLWVLHRMDPASPAYNLASAFRLSGPVDVSRLAASATRVVSRHRVLRSTLEEDGDGVRQLVHPPAPVPVESIEASAGDAETVAVRLAREPFNLETGPLVRLALVEDASGADRILLLVVHHIVADERSLAHLWRELAQGYVGERERDEDQRAPQFDDYVYWLSRQPDDDRASELDFWREQLNPAPDPLVLPFERSPAPSSVRQGRLLSRRLGSDVRDQIRQVAATIGATPFVVFAFLFRLLLERYVPGQRIAFATPVSTRSHPAAADMIGYFLNPVAVVVPVDETRPLDEAIRSFAREVRELLAHVHTPFDVLTEQLAHQRQPDRHPIFQAMFVYQELPPPPTLGDVSLAPVALDLGESKFDLTLFVSESDSDLELAVEYRTDRFDMVWMEQLLDHFGVLVTNLTDDLTRQTSELPMLTTTEKAQVLVEWQGAPSRAAAAHWLPDQILQRARQTPEALAVTCGQTRWTYRELERAAASVARLLQTRGVSPGARVALFFDRSPLLIAGLVGSQWAGAAYVPLDTGYPPARNAEMLRDAEVSVVLTTSDLQSRLPDGSWRAIYLDALVALEPKADEPDLELPKMDGSAPAYILYTSGSTGQPKGVVVTHDNLRASTVARQEVYERPPERFLLLPSIAFDSSVAGIFWTLASGGTLVVPTEDDARDVRRLPALVADEGVTTLLCVPSLYAQMLRFGGDRLARLSTAIVAGEPCLPQLVREHFEALPQVRLYNEYGPTEATVWATVQEVTADDANGPVPIGRPIPGVQVHVRDGFGRAVPAGVPGRGWIAGPTVAAGYWKRPELTDERFLTAKSDADPGRQYNAGDRLAWTPDGRLLFLGRDDDQIKLRGFRIEPGDIEAALQEQTSVQEAVVVVRSVNPGRLAGSEPDGSEQLVAFLCTSADVSSGLITRQLRERLPAYMVPGRFVELAEMPRLPNGKVDRAALRTLELGDADTEPPVAAQTTGTLSEREEALIVLWEGLLGRGGIKITDNFFELGGHSLLVVAMTDSIERDYGVSLPAADVFQHPTVQELARLIEDRKVSGATGYAHLFPIQPGGRQAPFIVAVPHFFSGVFAERFRGERPVYGLRGVSLRAEGNVGRWPTMTALATELADEIARRFPGRACVVAGYSFGASMAVETVRLMEKRGQPVERLYLIAPMPLDLYRVGPFQLQVGGLRRPLSSLRFQEVVRLVGRDNDPRTRRPYRRAWLLLAVRPWRRLLCLVGRGRRWLGRPLTPRILYADVRVERFRLHRTYRPGSIRTPTVIFNAEEPETDAAATWRPHFDGPFSVETIPDPHRADASVDEAGALILNRIDRDLGQSANSDGPARGEE